MKIKNKINPSKKESRSDFYDTLINHSNTKYIKVTFKYEVDNNNNHFVEVID